MLRPMDRLDDALPDLVVHFRIRTGLFRKERLEAELYTLDESGFIMKTDRLLEPGNSLPFDLIMHMPFDNITATGLQGLITERKKHCSNYFYGIDFLGADSRPRPDSSEKLGRILEVLSKKQSLKSRRDGTPSSSFGYPA